ncbi:HEPN-associated N-terminal domain-containing protein [Nocardioides sp. AX2bis]|uniref:HEPN-associated N-terminal domain-containing protein n=1 Tax=Nocardioides sp. AX2bis TaxID=2653157 RepID=UPI0012F30434|nr:HEPN-associated N-terminal domain-containing protein [Nocardioides sp. AX2bis]VXB45338.1 RES domain-containing protein [Nocardioides sp. AX2bis]
MELIESRGWSETDTVICSSCVTDEALQEAVRAEGGDDPCDYCDETPVAPEGTAPFDVITELVVDGLRSEYEDPNQSMGWEGGYVGAITHDTWDLVWDLEITEIEKVHDDLLRAIQLDLWCQRDPYAATPTQALTWGWQGFRDYVKHRRRFTFLVQDDSTLDGAGSLPMHAVPSAVVNAVAESDLVITLPAGTEYWRARVHEPGESYETAADIGTPPDSLARDNRMSPKGIGAFYGASSAGGAQAEVGGYASPTQEASLGCFSTTVPLNVVDLRVPPSVPSLFASDRHLRPSRQFLHDFIADVTKVADPADSQYLEYVPTQVVAEHFRYELAGNVRGVLWQSSKGSDVTSCVLFIPSDEVADGSAVAPDALLVLDPASVTELAAPLKPA